MFDYYYGCENEQFAFFQMPSVIIEDKKRFGKLSDGAKLLYMVLLDRVKLSRKTGWFDTQNRVYIIFSTDKIADKMGWGHNKACKVMKELDDAGLISRNRRGQGKASVIYVRNFIDTSLRQPDTPLPPNELIYDGEELPEDSELLKAVESVENFEEEQPYYEEKPPETSNANFQKFNNQTSKSLESKSLEAPKANANQNKKNKNKMSYSDFNHSITPAREKFAEELIDGLIDNNTRQEIEEQVCEAIEYDYLYPNDETLRGMVTEIKDIMVDVMCGNRNVVIGKRTVPAEAAKSAYSKLTSEHIRSVLYSILNYPERINRIDNFIAAVLYNAAFTENLATFTGFTANTGLKMI